MPKSQENPEISTKAQRQVVPNVIDQRQQQIDPAGKHRIDPDAPGADSTKQPGRREDSQWDPTDTGATDPAETRQEERDDLIR